MWTRRDHFDLRNGVIITLLAIIVVLYSKILHQSQVTTISNFTPEQKAHDAAGTTDPITNVAGSPVEVLPAVQVSESETTHFDGLVKYTRTTPNSDPNLLLLVLTQDSSSWGHDVDAPPRTFHDFLDILIATKLDLTRTSLALWTSSPSEYQLFRTAALRLNLARLSIFLDTSTPSSDRGNRHHPAAQSERRSRVAKFRNKLLLHALGPEPHHLWLDADVQFLSPGIVQRMLQHSSSNADAGIITARCQDGPTYNYDKNAWAGVRVSGPVSSDTEIAEFEDAPENRQRLVDELIDGTNDDDLIRLDAVGGTILYVRASLVWEGLNFPSYEVVGTRWGRDGSDGVETEGVCYASRKLEGGGCWVLGGEHYVKHTNL